MYMYTFLSIYIYIYVYIYIYNTHIHIREQKEMQCSAVMQRELSKFKAQVQDLARLETHLTMANKSNTSQEQVRVCEMGGLRVHAHTHDKTCIYIHTSIIHVHT